MFILSILLLIYSGTILLYSKISHGMKYKQAEMTYIDYEYNELNYTREQVRSEIENMVGKLPYFYKEKKIGLSYQNEPPIKISIKQNIRLYPDMFNVYKSF